MVRYPVRLRRGSSLIFFVVLILILIIIASNIWIWQHLKNKSLREQLTAKLKEQANAKYYDFLDKYTNDIFLLTDKDLKIVNVNDAAVKAYGYTKDELLTLSLKEIRTPETWKDLKKQMEYLLKNEGSVFETYHMKKNGKVFPVEISARFVNIEGEGYYQSIIRDISERVAFEEELIQRDKELSLIFNNVSDIIFYLSVEPNEQYRFLSINDNFSKAIGIPKEEIIGYNVKDVIPEPSLSVVLSKYSEAIAAKSIVQWEEVTEYPAGLKYGEVAIFPIFDENDKCINLVGTVHDVTERKKHEKIIADNQKQYQSFFEDDLTGDYVADLEGNILNCNPAFLKIFELESVDEAKKVNFYSLYPSDNEKENILQNLSASKRVDNFEIRMLTSRRKNIFVIQNIVGSFNEEGNLYQIKGYIIDITERRIAQRQLRKLSTAVEQSPVSIIITDTKGIIEYVNPKFCEVTGRSREEVIGNYSSIFSPDYNSESILSNLWKSILSGKVWSGELKNKKKDGTLFWESVTISPIIEANEKITSFIAVTEDITLKKQFEQELIIAKEKAEEMNRLKSSFLANMSHELRTPMIGILGYSEILLDEIKDKDQHEMVDGIFLSGNRLLRTLNLILDLSRIEANKFAVTLININIAEEVQTIIKSFLGISLKRKLSLETVIKDYDVYSLLDKRLFEQIMNNLINNALKYTDKGKITVIVDKQFIDDDYYSIVKVIDTGIGIPKDSLNLIFEEFRQVSEGISRHFEGTGLGLTITKKSVELLGGKIFVESELDVGSTFTIIFPSIVEKVSVGNED